MASVIYLTDTRYGQRAWQHPSARHRCYHYADALLACKRNAAVVPMEHVSRVSLKDFDHAIFHRPEHNRRFTHAFECCLAAGLELHADYDDLIFHPDFAPHSPQHISSGKDLSRVQRQFENIYSAACLFSSFLVSTSYLADKLRVIFPESSISVLPNSLPRIFSTPSRNTQNRKQLTIGYFPGSRGHSEDFKSILPVLKDVLGKNVRMLIVGRMNQKDYMKLDNVTHLPFATYTDYMVLLSLVDLSIAPLLHNEFNESKSAVKLIESVSVGTPIVASVNRDMAEHKNELSYLVKSETQWQESLQEVLESSALHRQDDLMVDRLRKRFCVMSRLPILQEHLRCAV